MNLDDDRPWRGGRKLPQPTHTPAFVTPSLATLPLFSPDLLALLGTLQTLSHLTAFTLAVPFAGKGEEEANTCSPY